MSSKFALMVLFASSVACSSSDPPKARIGEPCGNGCAANLFCYSDTTPPLDKVSGLCTMKCSASSGDTCKNTDPNTACLVGGICARECGNGLDCPAGTVCDKSGFCVRGF